MANDAARIRNYFRSLPTMTTQRLVLRPTQVHDDVALFSYGADPAMCEHNAHAPLAALDDARALIRRFAAERGRGNPHPWALVERSSRRLVGLCGFGAVDSASLFGELGYEVARTHWGHGYATEAVRAVLNAGFDQLGLHRVEALCATANLPSIRVLENCGFVLEGVLRGRMRIRDRNVDLACYALLAPDHVGAAPPGDPTGDP